MGTNEVDSYKTIFKTFFFFFFFGGDGLVAKSFQFLWPHGLQAPLSVGFLRQEYWSGFPFPSPGDLPNPGIETLSLLLQAVSCIAGGLFTNWATREAQNIFFFLRNCKFVYNKVKYKKGQY